jgi:hypothetical protein
MARDGRDNAGLTMTRGVCVCQIVTDRCDARKKVMLLE